jgi:hypothetical protein
VERKLRKQWLAARFAKCFATSTRNQRGTAKLNSKKANNNENNLSFEESAHRGDIAFIFSGIHTFQFIDHSNSDQERGALKPPSQRGDGVEDPSEIEVQPGTRGPEAGS